MPTTIDSAGITFNDATSFTSAVLAANSVGASQITNGSVTAVKLGTTEQKQIAKAWVNFDGATLGTWNGGASTVTRIAGSTTATITTTNSHGLTTGNMVYVLTGVVAGEYTVTVLTLNTFTITTVATTALNAVAITFRVATIRSSYNVSSITRDGTGYYTVNFATPMADANYSSVGISSNFSGADGYLMYEGDGSSVATSRTTSYIKYITANTSSALNSQSVNVVVFGN